jgi:acyl-CoA synthetase (AMP-forming)/AMP-acid ligase II
MPNMMVNQAPLTPLSFLERSASIFRDKVAVIYGRQQWTYTQFAARVNQFASALRAWGLHKGDRVAFLCPNIPTMLEAHFAVPLAGGLLVTLNTRLAPDDIATILNHAEARVLFVDTELAHLVAPVRDSLGSVELIVTIVDEQDGPSNKGFASSDYEGFLANGRPEPLDSLLEDELEPISINYTSGTTGSPKGVMYSHRGAYLAALAEAVEFGLDNRSVYLWTVPMFHCNGWCFPWTVTAVGGTHVCLRKFDPALVVALIMQEGVTHFCGAPTVLNMLVNDPASKSLHLRRPLRATTAGAPPSPTLIQAVNALGIQLAHVYGLTETLAPFSICEWQAPWDTLSAEEQARLKARQGVPFLHAGTMRVVDKNMNDVPADGRTMGEVVMRGNGVMLGYFNNPDATAAAFRGGWFHSGDLAVMHPDGYIELRDRAKDIIISGGENISTIEVEQTIAKHPAVLEVAVVAIPDEKWGEVPKAFVMTKPDGVVTQDEIIDFCRERLAHFKCPKAVEFGPLPKTATGKIQKYVLRQKEWVGYQKAIH